MNNNKEQYNGVAGGGGKSSAPQSNESDKGMWWAIAVIGAIAVAAAVLAII